MLLASFLEGTTYVLIRVILTCFCREVIIVTTNAPWLVKCNNLRLHVCNSSCNAAYYLPDLAIWIIVKCFSLRT